MTREITGLKPLGVSLAVAVALISPAGAHAASNAQTQAGQPRDASALEAATGVAGSAAAQLQRPARGDAGSREQEAALARGGGLDGRDAAVAAAILVGVVLMGLRGYVVVGAVIAVVAGLLGAGARLATGEPRGGRGWSEWSRPASAPVERQKRRHRRLSHLGQTNDPELTRQ